MAVDIYGRRVQKSPFIAYLGASRQLDLAQSNLATAIIEALDHGHPAQAVCLDCADRANRVMTQMWCITDIDDLIVVEIAKVLCARHRDGPELKLGWNCDACMGQTEAIRQRLIAEPE